jgi:hypothetical protein
MQIWSCGRYDLGLTDEEFFQLTPRKLDALLKRHRRKTESTELLFAQLTSCVVNTGFRSTEEPTKIRDFMPSQWDQAAAKQPKKSKFPRRKRSSIATEIRTVMGHFMGTQ